MLQRQDTGSREKGRQGLNKELQTAEQQVLERGSREHINPAAGARRSSTGSRRPSPGGISREHARLDGGALLSSTGARRSRTSYRSSFASELARRLGEVAALQGEEGQRREVPGSRTGFSPPRMRPPPPLSRAETAGSRGGKRQLQQTLNRRKQNFTGDLADLKLDARELGQGAIPKAKLDILEGEGARLRDMVQEVGESYQRCIEEATDQREVEDLELEGADFEEWARTELRKTRREIRSHILEPPTQRNASSHLERVKLPSFGGEAHEFHEFRRTFTELTSEAGYPPAVLMAQLRTHLSRDPLRLVEGHTEVAGAWKELERRYGSKDLAVVTSRQKLISLQLRGAGYEQVEALLQAVRTARTTLRSNGVESLLFGDYATVGLLVAKLPVSAQERWDFHTATLAAEDTPQGRGEEFCRWLEREGTAAASARLRNIACEQQRRARQGGTDTGNPTRCNKCGKNNHQTLDCNSGSTLPSLAGSALAAAGGRVEDKRKEEGNSSLDPGHIPKEEWAAKLRTKEGASELLRRLEGQGASCPVCRKIHYYRRKLSWGEIDWPSNRFDSCTAFTAATPPHRSKILDDHGGCTTCLSWAHTSRRCNLKEPRNPGPGARTLRCQEETGKGVCGKEHNRMLHGAEVSHGTANAARILTRPVEGPRPDIFQGRPGDLLAAGPSGTAFEILEATVLSQSGAKEQDRLFVDGGSNMNFITHELARRLQLVGTSTDIFLKVVDSEYQAKEVKIFQLGVLDRDQKEHWMEAVGVESITEAAPLVDEVAVRKAFPEILEEAIRRPVGPVGVLLSMTERELHSSGGRMVGKMRLSDTPLGWDGGDP